MDVLSADLREGRSEPWVCILGKKRNGAEGQQRRDHEAAAASI